jgi:hypothetical protein
MISPEKVAVGLLTGVAVALGEAVGIAEGVAVIGVAVGDGVAEGVGVVVAQPPPTVPESPALLRATMQAATSYSVELSVGGKVTGAVPRWKPLASVARSWLNFVPNNAAPE